jgi:hypothetical protein
MTGALQQRCWNHETREAVCRCPECRRSYCRECVTEHEARLLCASCLRTLAARRPAGSSGLRRLLPAALTLAGVALAWLLFLGGGELLVWVTARMEQTSWQSR